MDIAGVLAIGLAFGAPTAIAIVAIITGYKETRKRQEAILKALELGKSPDEINQLFAPEKQGKGKNGIGFLKGGIVVVGLSLGLAFMGLFLPTAGVSGLFAASALIVVLGASLIIVYLVSRKKEKAE